MTKGVDKIQAELVPAASIVIESAARQAKVSFAHAMRFFGPVLDNHLSDAISLESMNEMIEELKAAIEAHHIEMTE